MVEIRNAQDLETWLEGKPPTWLFEIAFRRILRIAAGFGTDFENLRKIVGWRDNVVKPIFRSVFQIAEYQYSKRINPTTNLVWTELQHAKNETRQSVMLHDYMQLISNLTLNQPDLEKILAGLNLSDLKSFRFIFPVSDVSTYKQLVSAFNLDCTALETGVDLWSQPLWLDDIPEWAVSGWETLATELTRRAPYWKTLVQWYEDRIRGDDWAASQGRPAIPELEIARASLPDAIWKKGGKAVNLAIAELEAKYWGAETIEDWEDLDGDDPGDRGFPGMGWKPSPIHQASPDPILDPPTLPLQSHGPHFGLRNGLLDFAPPDHLDPAKNNIQRLKSLHPLLLAEAMSALELFARNKAHAALHSRLDRYVAALTGDVGSLNYDVLCGYGTILKNAESAATRSIVDRLEPEFEDSERTALTSVLDLHGQLVLATETGQIYVADAERYERSPAEETTFRENAVSLAEAIDTEEIAKKEIAVFVKDASTEMGLGAQPERSAVFGIGTIRNASVVLISGAALYHPTVYLVQSGMLNIVAGALGLPVAAIVTAVVGKLTLDGVARSDAGKALSDVVTNNLNAVTRSDVLKKIHAFVVAYEDRLRKVAGTSREWKWLRDWLDWLKANARD